jgi:hypothetical protein
MDSGTIGTLLGNIGPLERNSENIPDKPYATFGPPKGRCGL